MSGIENEWIIAVNVTGERPKKIKSIISWYYWARRVHPIELVVNDLRKTKWGTGNAVGSQIKERRQFQHWYRIISSHKSIWEVQDEQGSP